MSEPTNRSRAVLISGILFLCLLGLTLVSPLAILTIWLMPIPFIMLVVLGHRAVPVIFAAIFALALIVLGFNFAALLFAGAAYFVGFVMGEALHKSRSPYTPLISGTLVYIMLMLVLLAFARFAGIDIFQVLSRQMTASFQADSSWLGISQKGGAAVVVDTIARIKLLLPAFICTFAFFAAAVNLYIGRWLCKAPVRRTPILGNWRLPYWSVLAYLLVLILSLFHVSQHSTWLLQVILNAQFLLGLMIGIQGLSAIWRYLSRYRGGKVWFMLVTVSCVFRVVGSVCVLIGLFDMINDSYRDKRNGRGR